ncbi:MAG: amidohydrolase family protein [Candidatus Dormibacteraeota bacterium]|nr:amidohydrolase family protein [Candidatus Dormibacteraeota bacterium]
MIRFHGVRLLGSGGLSGPQTIEVQAEDADAERDATGLILSPGWIDLHAHLRDPGFPESETLATASASAAAGGFTHVVAMANTNPVTDHAGLVSALLERAATMPVRLSVVAALTERLEGRTLTDADALHQAGAVALSDDGRHAMDRRTLTRGLQAAGRAGLPVLVHGQLEALGRDPVAEDSGIAQALEALADAPGARLHLQHVSTRKAVERLRAAKAAGLTVTAEVTPHHLALTAADVRDGDPNVSPPLRTSDDRDATVEALIDGVIDVIATDHAPHSAAAKAAGSNGYHGLEIAAGVVLGLQLPWSVLHRALVTRPAEILGLGPTHDWILIDPGERWTVDPTLFASRGRNTPFAGRQLRGRVTMTLCRNQVVYREASLVG